MTDTSYLTNALASLGSRRHALKVAAADQRDAAVQAGDHSLARVWNALAATIAGIEDEERRVLRRLEDDLHGIEEPPC